MDHLALKLPMLSPLSSLLYVRSFYKNLLHECTEKSVEIKKETIPSLPRDCITNWLRILFINYYFFLSTDFISINHHDINAIR